MRQKVSDWTADAYEREKSIWQFDDVIIGLPLLMSMDGSNGPAYRVAVAYDHPLIGVISDSATAARLAKLYKTPRNQRPPSTLWCMVRGVGDRASTGIRLASSSDIIRARKPRPAHPF